MICIYDPATGRVSQCSGDGGPEFEAQLRDSNISFVTVGSTPMDTYVDISTEEPCLRRRPVIEGKFEPERIAPGQTSKHPNLPRGTVSINGPEGSMTHEHLGGELEFEFEIPGKYDILTDLWPYQYRSYTIEVSTVPPQESE